MTVEHLTTILFLAMFLPSAVICFAMQMGIKYALMCISGVIALSGFVTFLAYVAQELAHIILS